MKSLTHIFAFIILFGLQNLTATEYDINRIAEKNLLLFDSLPTMRFRYSSKREGYDREGTVVFDLPRYYISIHATSKIDNPQIPPDFTFACAYDGIKYYHLNKNRKSLIMGSEDDSPAHLGAVDETPIFTCFRFIYMQQDSRLNNLTSRIMTSEGWRDFIERSKNITILNAEGKKNIKVLLSPFLLHGQIEMTNELYFDIETLFPVKRIYYSKDGARKTITSVKDYMTIEGKGGSKIIFPLHIHIEIEKQAESGPHSILGKRNTIIVDKNSIEILKNVPIEQFRIPTTEAESIYDSDLGEWIKLGDRTGMDAQEKKK
jgi:hypothetical protein